MAPLEKSYKCHTCGRHYNWDKDSSWYGSYEQIDNGEPVLFFCSDKCMEAHNEIAARPKTKMETVKLIAEVKFTLECPNCSEYLRVKEPIVNWANQCVKAIGYGNEYANNSENLPIKCEECGHEFAIDGVEREEIND